MGRDVAMRLLDEIYRGGCCDAAYQWLAALFMALGQKHVSKFLTGALTPRYIYTHIEFLTYALQLSTHVSGPLSTYTVHFLQHLRDFFSITFKLENPEADEDEQDDMRGAQKVLMTCVGIGYTNISKRVL